mmetsp:Transcript_47095/g.132818  ORF Transcript_47095/g.132818 Transcript_47095/m.132818 type:complete len:93 (-) Transcript_47095:235-513(-)
MATRKKSAEGPRMQAQAKQFAGDVAVQHGRSRASTPEAASMAGSPQELPHAELPQAASRIDRRTPEDVHVCPGPPVMAMPMQQKRFSEGQTR